MACEAHAFGSVASQSSAIEICMHTDECALLTQITCQFEVRRAMPLQVEKKAHTGAGSKQTTHQKSQISPEYEAHALVWIDSGAREPARAKFTGKRKWKRQTRRANLYFLLIRCVLTNRFFYLARFA
jgi:hypothetical protein